MNRSPKSVARLVVVPPPTPNGPLHVGHLSGPYLHADIYRRHRALHGERTSLALHTDDHQSYVQVASARGGESASELATRHASGIQRTLRLAQIDFDGFGRATGAEYVASIDGFFRRLFERGAIQPGTATLFREPTTDGVLVDAYVKGECPVCLDRTAFGICETCGHPCLGDDLRAPVSATTGRSVTPFQAEVLVFDLEPHRASLTELDRGLALVRPSLRRLYAELMSRPRLPTIAVTYPVPWGARCSIPGFESHSYNPWLELAAGHLAMAERAGAAPTSASKPPVCFLGFDNSFFYAMAHVALYAAAGIPAIPEALVTNEFYELEGEKFSTSNQHAIWADAALEQFGADALRYYLARTGPSFQRSSFEADRVPDLLEREVITPLLEIFDARQRLIGGGATTRLGVDFPFGAEEKLIDHFESLYSLRHFDVPGIARVLENLLRATADGVGPGAKSGRRTDTLLGFIDGRLLLFAAYGYPIMPSTCGELARLLTGSPVSELFRGLVTDSYRPRAVNSDRVLSLIRWVS